MSFAFEQIYEVQGGQVAPIEGEGSAEAETAFWDDIVKRAAEDKAEADALDMARGRKRTRAQAVRPRHFFLFELSCGFHSCRL